MLDRSQLLGSQSRAYSSFFMGVRIGALPVVDGSWRFWDGIKTNLDVDLMTGWDSADGTSAKK